ncbi:MAG: hypothetical protein LBS19_15155 [Clostridiales bacterium]|nr:hypothetical protein [Clostridiales bacterium]
MKKRILAMLLAAAVFAAAFGADPKPITASEPPVSAVALSKATLYADFSFAAPEGPDNVITLRVTANDIDADKLAELLSQWTGLDFILESWEVTGKEIAVDWSVDSTLVAGIDDLELWDDVEFESAENLYWFMMDSLSRTLKASLGVETVYYSVDGGEPLTWDEGVMTGLTVLPVDQSYEGSAFFLAHADVKGGDDEATDIELLDDEDANAYLLDEMSALVELGIDFEYYGDEEIGGEDCRVFELYFWYGEDEYDYSYIHDIAVTASGEIFAPGVEEEWVLIAEAGEAPEGAYYLDGEPDGGVITFNVDGSGELILPDDDINSLEIEWVSYGDRLYFAAELDGEYEADTLIIVDGDLLTSEYGEVFIREEREEKEGEPENEDAAYDYLCEELSALTAIDFDFVFDIETGYDTNFDTITRIDDQDCRVFDIVAAYGIDDGVYAYADSVAVSPDGSLYFPVIDFEDLSAEEWEQEEQIDFMPEGVYYYEGDPEMGGLAFQKDGTLTVTDMDGEEVGGKWAVYGNRAYMIVDYMDDTFGAAALYIGGEDALYGALGESFFREGGETTPVELSDEQTALDYLNTELAGFIDMGMELEYYDTDEIDGEEHFVFELYMNYGDDDTDYLCDFAVGNDGTVLAEDFNYDWFELGSFEAVPEGTYALNKDMANGYITFNADGTLKLGAPYDEMITVEGVWSAYGSLIYILVDLEDETNVLPLVAKDNNSLLMNAEEGFYKEESGSLIPEADSAYDFLINAAAPAIAQSRFDFVFEENIKLEDEEARVFALVWEDTEGVSRTILDYFAVTKSLDLYILNILESEWAGIELPGYEIGGYYYYNSDPEDNELYFYMDGTVDLEDEDSLYEGEYTVIGDRCYIMLEEEGEAVFSCLYIQNEETLIIDEEDHYSTEVE